MSTDPSELAAFNAQCALVRVTILQRQGRTASHDYLLLLELIELLAAMKERR